MLESILSFKTIRRSPWDAFILGVILTTASIFAGYYLSYFIEASASILALALLIISLAPLMHGMLSKEYDTDEEIVKKHGHHSFMRHADTIAIYSFLFLGMMAAFCFWFSFLPAESSGLLPSYNAVFDEQLNAYGALTRQTATGHFVACNACFDMLYKNNLNILIYCFLASFLFGVGAIWLLSWNASIIAVAIGMKIRQELANIGFLHAYFMGFSKYSLGMAVWAVPEVGAYFVAALSGGIISVAVSRHHFLSREFWFAVYDALLLLALAVLLVILGAYIEHYFVPLSACI